MSDLQKIIAFDKISPYLDENAQSLIVGQLGLTKEEIDRRLKGIHKESEFLLLLLFADVCKDVTGADEGLSQIFETPTSDLEVVMKDGSRYYIEIKSTDKTEYSISSGNLNKRIEWAKGHNMELLFAICIKNFWMLFKSDYLVSKNGKIDFSDFNSSIFDTFLKTGSFMFFKGTKIRTVYTTEERDDLTGILHPEYGGLLSYDVYFNKNRIFRVKGRNSPNLAFSFLLEGLQDRLSICSQTIKQKGVFTEVIEEIPDDGNFEMQIISEYEFFLAHIKHMQNDQGIVYTPHSYAEIIKTFPEIKKTMIDKRYIHAAIMFLRDNGMLIEYGKNGQFSDVKNWYQ